jgi:lipopolysaccharide export LptBFGC system permease protein LptF
LTQQSGDDTLPPSDKEAAAKDPTKQPDYVPRESMVGGVVSSVKYLQDAHAETGVIKLRKADRVTWILLLIALGLICATMFVQNQKGVLTLIADALFAVVLFAFMAMRFGVLRSLSARQAVLVWQLIVGGFLLGLYAALNTKLIALMMEGTLFR